MIYDVNGNQISTDSTVQRKPWKKNGVMDALAITKQLCKIDWETTATGMPKTSSSSYASEEEAIGMPYSSASVEDGYIGISISPYTFMSAVHNPRSVLYNEESKGYTGVAYYGTICTSLVCAAWGIPCLITTIAMRKFDRVQQLDSLADIELGDMLLSYGHARLVTGIKRDSGGTITHVQTSESVTPNCKENAYLTYADFVTASNGFYPYRYKDINSVDAYQASPFFRQFDETEKAETYPDIMTYYGDKVTRKYGTSIEIDVLESTGYNKIEVFKNGTLINTINTIADFTISTPEVGDYEVRMTGDDKSSSTFFDIVDAHLAVDSNIASYDATYGALAIGGYPTYTVDSNGKATSWNNPKRVHIITDQEDVAREVDISEMLNDSECDGGLRLYVRGVYGSVSFEFPYS